MSHRDGRSLRREWKRNKPHLRKSDSLPALQLTPADRPTFLCQRCGFTNSLIPMCLWCRWTSDNAHIAFELSMPRARRVSAPSRIFWNVSTVANRTSTYGLGQLLLSSSPSPKSASLDLGSQPCSSPASVSTHNGSWKWSSKGPEKNDSFKEVHCSEEFDADATRQRNLHRASVGVVKATDMHQPEQEVKRLHEVSGTTSSRLLRLPSSFSHSSAYSSVDRSTTTTTKTMNVASNSLKSLSRRVSVHRLKADLPNTVASTISEHDIYGQYKPSSQNDVQPTEEHRILRRKRRLNIVQQTSTTRKSLEPIAISLNLCRPISSTSSNDTPNSILNHETQLLYATTDNHVKALSKLESATSALISPPSQTTSRPPRLGHPSRPYYTAIRKHCMSSPTPPPSRPTSLIDIPSTPSSRPTSGNFPPSAFNNRPLSTSVLPSVFSAFALEDEDLDAHGDAEHGYYPHATSASAPATANGKKKHNSLSRAFAKRLSAQSTVSTNAGSGMSPGRSRGSIGFSMSGETELRMALAQVQQEQGVSDKEREYRFRETSNGASEYAGGSSGERQQKERNGGVLSRVRKLRKNLKELLTSGVGSSSTKG